MSSAVQYVNMCYKYLLLLLFFQLKLKALSFIETLN